MPWLNGQQFIFTRVEPEYSPSHYGGYQMVYRSPGLSPALVASCEERVKSFHPPIPDLVRWQFFTVENSVVLTHSMQVETVREINDRDGRPGIFLCHGLVFTAADFTAATGNNPFPVFDCFDFVKDAPTLVQAYNQKTGGERPCQINWKDIIPPHDGWLKESPKFVKLAYQARQLKSQGQFLLFFGTEAEIAAALRIIFYLIPERERLACSFDTHIEQMKTAAGQFWAVGAPDYQAGSTLLVNCRSHLLDGDKLAVPPKDMYLVWLAQHVGDSPEAVLTQAPTIQELTRAFRENKLIPPESMSEEAILSFLEQFKPQVEERLHAIFAAQVSPQLANSLVKWLFRTCPDKLYILNIAAIRGLPRGKLIEYVKDWFCEQAPQFALLKSGEWERLENLARKENDPVLQFWTAIHFDDNKARHKSLAQMNTEAFIEATELMFKPFGPMAYLHPKHVARWIERIQEERRAFKDDDFVKLVLAAIEAGGATWMDRWASRIASLENKALTRLEKQVEKVTDLSPDFRFALRQRRQQEGPPYSFFDNLKDIVLGEKETKKNPSKVPSLPKKDDKR